MLSFNLSIKNGKHLTKKEISEATAHRAAGAFASTTKLCEHGWGVVCKDNKLIFTHPNIVTLPDTLQHLKNLNLSTEPLEFSGGAVPDDEFDNDFDDDDFDDDDDDDDDDEDFEDGDDDYDDYLDEDVDDDYGDFDEDEDDYDDEEDDDEFDEEDEDDDDDE